MPAPLVSIRNASVVYNPSTTSEVRAISSVSLDIYENEFIIFFGPSGCGKSTLLYAIAGLERLNEGEIHIAGRNIAGLSPKEMVDYHRLFIGMVFQAYYLIPSISVRANVVLPQIFLGKQKPERIKLGEGLMERFGILSQKGKLPTQLSGGQQQRVAISRALVNDPPIILADEPVGNLDSKSAQDVLKLLVELNEKDKKTIILVTHNPSYLNYATRIFYLQDGRLVREVRNEQKKQVREMELKPLNAQWLNEFARLYPQLSEETLKAKMIALYLLDQIDIEDQSRIENIIQQFFSGHIDRGSLSKMVSGSIREGGFGFYRSHAERLSDELDAIIHMSRYLKKNFGTFPRIYGEYEKILERIGSYLLLGTDAHLNEEQLKRFHGAIKARLEGSLDKLSFEEALDRPAAEGGAGFNVRTSRNITRRLELLLVDYPSSVPTSKDSVSKDQKSDEVVLLANPRDNAPG